MGLETCIYDLNSEISDLRDRLFLLTGCRYFDEMAGDVGCCVDCSDDNEELWRKCSDFSSKLYAYRRGLKDV